MPLAGQHHVLPARQADPHRPADLRRRQRGHRGPGVGLHFLAAERAAHAQALDDDGVLRQPEHPRHDLLRLGRMLGRRVDHQPAVVVAIGERGVGLEVEVLLAADAQLALEAVRRVAQRGLGVAAVQAIAVGEEAAGGNRVLDRPHRRQRFVVDADRAGREARGLLGLGDHPGNRLAGEADLGGKQRLVVPRRARVVLAGHVGGGEHGDHADRRERGAGVDRYDPRVRSGCLDRPGVGDVRDIGPQIVDVAGRAGDVADRRFVRQAGADSAGGGVGVDRADRLVHRTAPAGAGAGDAVVSATHFSSSRPIIARR